MSFLHRYAVYLKDNPNGYWFKRKAYGWGWVPATWQGWLTIAIFIAMFVAIFVPFVSDAAPSQETVNIFLVSVGAWLVGLLGICSITGEEPRWQWGIPKKRKR